MPRARIAEPCQLTYGASETETTLRSLIDRDLGFKKQRTAYAAHNTHAFAAKFPPQLPKLFIDGLTVPGDKVLDPMVGSGTLLVEAALAGRTGIGVDIDPLAVRISQAKTRPIDPEVIASLAHDIAAHADSLVTRGGPAYKDALLSSFDDASRAFIEYWFQDTTIAELGALMAAIRVLTPLSYRAFFEVLFSSTIVTKSGGVSLARDLAHSRPHKVPTKRIKNAIQVFQQRAAAAVAMLAQMQNTQGQACVLRGDSKKLPLPSESVDLIVTSPPYANAIDYVRAHKFSLVWLGYPIQSLTLLRQQYIGAESRRDGHGGLHSETGRETLSTLATRDPRRAQVIARYFHEMTTSLGEMYRVLRQGKAAILVVGSSSVRNTVVPTALVLAEIGQYLGFRLIGVRDRDIDRDRRLMPISHHSNETGIEARLHREQVVALVKP